jgi:predicted ATPase/DNA-binding SARP family transcriptional activator
MTLLGLKFLGELSIQQESTPLAALKSQKGQALLCYLALTGKAYARSMLAGLFWPEMPEADALMNLRKVLNRLNPHLAPYLTITWQTVAFNQDSAYWLDVAEFEAGAATKEDIGCLQTAVALYQGDFLDGFTLPDAPQFEEWVLAQRARLREMALSALHTLITHFAAQAEYEAAIAYTRQLLAIEPWREEGHRELMCLLALAGQRSAALVQYELCRRILAEELDVEPAPATVNLYDQIRHDRLGKPDPTSSDGPTMVQLKTADLPESTKTPRHYLPLQLNSFIGREWELAEVGRLLASSRLVTLTGPGGCGKTRLALQAITAISDTFADGIWFVQLAPLSEAALLPQVVANTLNVHEVENRPPLTLLLNYLRARQLLLVLDNCEHLIEAAAQLADMLLPHCPHLQMLATSREALNIAGEVVWLVPTLSLPEPGAPTSLEIIQQADAVRLFVERATAVLPTFTLTDQNAAVVTQVCRRLDGLPLAIELAAARVKMLRVEQIAARLDDRFHLLAGGSRTALPRHQTLDALIDWSYDLLTPAEQRLLRWLAVLAGGFTLDAVEAMCAGEDEGDGLELLAQLVNKSLVAIIRKPEQEARYHLLETIRQYGWAKLDEAGETGPAQARHLDYFWQLAETAEPLLYTTEQIVWLDRLEAEHDNFRAALAWSLETPDGDLESGLRLVTALAGLWIMRSHFREGHRWLELALAKRHGAVLPVQARLLLNAGWLWYEQWESDPTALLQESLSLYRQLDDKKGTAWTLSWLGFCALRSDLDAATSQLSESLNLAREVGDKPLLIKVYGSLTYLAMLKGDYGQVTERGARVMALIRETGDRRMKYHLLIILGRSARRQHDYAGASAFSYEALALVRELKNRVQEGHVWNDLGEAARVQRAYEQAAAFYRESMALYQEVDHRGGIANGLSNLGLLSLGQGDWRQAATRFRESIPLAREINDKYFNLWNVRGLAGVALGEGHPWQAAQLLAAARLHEEIGHMHPVDRGDYERDVALARAQLGEEAFVIAWATGQAMSLEQAIAYALEEI